MTATGLPAADTLSRAADLVSKQPITAFVDAAPQSPGWPLGEAMKCAGRYMDDDGTDHAHSMATYLLEFARRLLREEET